MASCSNTARFVAFFLSLVTIACVVGIAYLLLTLCPDSQCSNTGNQHESVVKSDASSNDLHELESDSIGVDFIVESDTSSNDLHEIESDSIDAEIDEASPEFIPKLNTTSNNFQTDSDVKNQNATETGLQKNPSVVSVPSSPSPGNG